MKILRILFLLFAVGDSFRINREESSAVQSRSKRGLGNWIRHWLKRRQCDPFKEPCDD